MRLESLEGLDAASFLYQSLQAYDFLHLHRNTGCQLQVILLHSGSDSRRSEVQISGAISRQGLICVKSRLMFTLMPRVRHPLCKLIVRSSLWFDRSTASFPLG